MARRGLSEVAIDRLVDIHGAAICEELVRRRLRDVATNDHGRQVIQMISDHCDPTHTAIYSRWILQRFLKGDENASPFNDVGRLHINGVLTRYDLIKPLLPDVRFRDINLFSTIADLYDFMLSVEDMDIRSIRQRDRDEEQQLIENGEVKIIHNDDTCKILHIQSSAAAILFGRNTKWCLTTASDIYFNRYRRDTLIFYILLKGEGRQERYALAVPRARMASELPGQLEFRNSANDYYSKKIVEEAYPEPMRKLREYYDNLTLVRRDADTQGIINMLHDVSSVDMMANTITLRMPRNRAESDAGPFRFVYDWNIAMDRAEVAREVSVTENVPLFTSVQTRAIVPLPETRTATVGEVIELQRRLDEGYTTAMLAALSPRYLEVAMQYDDWAFPPSRDGSAG